MEATQRVKVMLVKGWSRRLTFCAAPLLLSMLPHWQPAAPPDACRRHFNANVSIYAPATNASMAF
jgi:hypothetical protein